jgi:hypothetical protein
MRRMVAGGCGFVEEAVWAQIAIGPVNSETRRTARKRSLIRTDDMKKG